MRTCPYCGRKIRYDHIPPEIRAAAERSGLPKPIWYAGRLMCPDFKVRKGLGQIVAEARAAAGLEPPTLASGETPERSDGGA